MPLKDAIYYHVAYTLAAIVYSGYAVSLWWRRRKWQRKG